MPEKNTQIETLITLVKDLITVELVVAGAGPKEVRKVLGSASNNKIPAIKSAIKKS